MSDFLRLLSLNTARIVFVGALLLVLVAGLNWALRPADRPETAQTVELDIAATATASPPPEPDPATPTSAPTTTATEEAPEVLIAAARAPVETSVQVLDAGGGSARVDRAVAAIEQLGYEVVAINPADRGVERTTVAFTGDARPEALALRARDPRFQEIEPNTTLSDSVDLHVLVGTDF